MVLFVSLILGFMVGGVQAESQLGESAAPCPGRAIRTSVVSDDTLAGQEPASPKGPAARKADADSSDAEGQ